MVKVCKKRKIFDFKVFYYWFFFYRYFCECDFGRINFWIISGMMNVMRKNKCCVIIVVLSVRYRRLLEFF